jgi:hypothetical protein
MPNRIKYWISHIVGCLLIILCSGIAGDKGVLTLVTAICTSVTGGIIINNMSWLKTPLLKGFVVIGGATLIGIIFSYLVALYF